MEQLNNLARETVHNLRSVWGLVGLSVSEEDQQLALLQERVRAVYSDSIAAEQQVCQRCSSCAYDAMQRATELQTAISAQIQDVKRATSQLKIDFEVNMSESAFSD